MTAPKPASVSWWKAFERETQRLVMIEARKKNFDEVERLLNGYSLFLEKHEAESNPEPDDEGPCVACGAVPGTDAYDNFHDSQNCWAPAPSGDVVNERGQELLDAMERVDGSA